MDVKLPDGTIIQNVPDGTTRDQLTEKLKANGYDITKLMQAAAKGAVTGGPGGAAIGAANESQRQGGEILEKAAYNLGGKVTDVTGSSAAGYATNVATQAIPSLMSGSALSRVTSPVTKWAGRQLMSSALKPSLEEFKKGKAGPAIETMLKTSGFNPTASGVEKMKGRLSDLGDDVERAITQSGAQVDVHDVANYVPQAYKNFQSGPQAVSAINDLGEVQAGLINHPMVGGARSIPVQTAHEMKRGYQKAVGDKGYDQLKTATTEGEKQVARGFREKVAQAVPSVVAPLKEESDIIRALKMAERQAAVDARKNPLGLGWLAQPWMIPFWMWDRSPTAKAMTARGLYSGDIPFSVGAGGTAPFMMLNGRAPEEQ